MLGCADFLTMQAAIVHGKSSVPKCSPRPHNPTLMSPQCTGMSLPAAQHSNPISVLTCANLQLHVFRCLGVDRVHECLAESDHLA